MDKQPNKTVFTIDDFSTEGYKKAFLRNLAFEYELALLENKERMNKQNAEQSNN